MTAETNWTYDRPTEPGYYWVVIYSSPEIVYVDRCAGKLVVSVFDEDLRNLSECNGWQWWPWPIAAPNPPPEDDYVGP